MDIAGIMKYGITQFGFIQAKRYLLNLEENLELLPDRPEIWREVFFVRKELYKYKFKAHMIFFSFQNKEIYVVRILGQHMDFEKHL